MHVMTKQPRPSTVPETPPRIAIQPCQEPNRGNEAVSTSDSNLAGSTRDSAVWSAVYAVAWCGPTSGPPGVVTDVPRAVCAAMEADRAVAALCKVRQECE